MRVEYEYPLPKVAKKVVEVAAARLSSYVINKYNFRTNLNTKCMLAQFPSKSTRFLKFL